MHVFILQILVPNLPYGVQGWYLEMWPTDDGRGAIAIPSHGSFIAVLRCPLSGCFWEKKQGATSQRIERSVTMKVPANILPC